MYEEPYMKTFLMSLEPAFKIPGRYSFSGRILEAWYIEKKSHLLRIIARNPAVNLVVNESSNKNSIVSLCIVTTGASFRYKYQVLPPVTWTAERQATCWKSKSRSWRQTLTIKTLWSAPLRLTVVQ